MTFPAQMLRETAFWLARFSSDYRGEIPQRIHSSEIADDGSPQWDPVFRAWITAREVISTPHPEQRTPEERLRTTRALRRLRKAAVREFEVVYRIMVLGNSVEMTTIWLNERALRNAIPLPNGRSVNYREKDTVAILVSGIDKMREWW